MTTTDLIIMFSLVTSNVFGIGVGMAIRRRQERRRFMRECLDKLRPVAKDIIPLSDAWENYTP
jgi:glucose-6-phosphate-specific signal transduction histidine kinase